MAAVQVRWEYEMPSIIEEGILGVMEAATNIAIAESTGAVEAFRFFQKENAPNFDFLSKLTPDTAYNTLEKVLHELRGTLMRYEANLSSETSRCVNMMFNVSERNARLYLADIKKYQAEAAQLKRALKEKGLPQETRMQYQAAFDEARGREDQARDRVSALRKDIPVPMNMLQCVHRCDGYAANSLKLIDDGWKKYEKTINGYFEEADFRYQIKPEDFIEELTVLREDLKQGTTKKAIDNFEMDAMRSVQRDIMGQTFDENACNGSYSLKTAQMLNLRFKGFKKFCADVYGRISKDMDLCRNLRKEEPEATFNMILADVMVLGYFCMLMSRIMAFSLRPHFALVEAASALATKKN